MDLLRQLLTYDPMRRISADEALRHPWIKLFSKGDNNEEATMLALVNLSKYNT
jgi:serine/threonine protein kinase